VSPFEFIFALYGLLLGLSLVELLGGLARTVEARLRPATPDAPVARTGWLTPMLALFLMLDLISFWYAAWVIRELLVVKPVTLLAGLLFAGIYYVAAHLVFPRELDGGVDGDAHYSRVKRPVLLAMLALLGVQLGYYMTVPQLAARFWSPVSLTLTGVLVLLLLTAVAARSWRLNAAALGALILRYLITYML
jgi:small-conductance mechanosensitive channel